MPGVTGSSVDSARWFRTDLARDAFKCLMAASWFPVLEFARCRAAHRPARCLQRLLTGEDITAQRAGLWGKRAGAGGGDQTPREAHAGRGFVRKCPHDARCVAKSWLILKPTCISHHRESSCEFEFLS